jgi:hypothetical protein
MRWAKNKRVCLILNAGVTKGRKREEVRGT